MSGTFPGVVVIVRCGDDHDKTTVIGDFLDHEEAQLWLDIASPMFTGGLHHFKAHRMLDPVGFLRVSGVIVPDQPEVSSRVTDLTAVLVHMAYGNGDGAGIVSVGPFGDKSDAETWCSAVDRVHPGSMQSMLVRKVYTPKQFEANIDEWRAKGLVEA